MIRKEEERKQHREDVALKLKMNEEKRLKEKAETQHKIKDVLKQKPLYK